MDDPSLRGNPLRFSLEGMLAGRYHADVPATTGADLAVSREAAELGYTVSPREVRSLREYGVLETLGDGKGGRGKDQPYVAGSAFVVAAIENAKEDETYKRKLHRAVLIAWARPWPRQGANVGTVGLRRAFAEMYDAEERASLNLLDGKRVEDGEPELRFGPSFNRAVAAAHLGRNPTPEDLATFEEQTGDTIRAAFWRSGQRSLLPGEKDNTTLGLAERRSDGTWRVTNTGEALWGAMALAPMRKIARTAGRAELEAALVLSRSMLPAHGFSPSDFVTACGVPRQIEWMRRWYGYNWWGGSPNRAIRRRKS